MSVEILNKLTLEKKRIEKDTSLKINIIIKECNHHVRHAYYFPHKCEKCSYNYVKYCILNNIVFPKILEYTTHISDVNDSIGRELKAKEIIEEEARIALENAKKKQEKHKAVLEKYGSELSYYILQRNLSYEEIGKRYERFIGYLYELDGYRVEYHGIKKGKEDGGIDIIAKAINHIVIVQCKRRGKNNFIHENTINQLAGTLLTFKLNNPFKNLKCVLYTQNDNLDDHAKATLHLHRKEIEHHVKPYPFDVGLSYPLIKCNIGKNNEKIFHLPTDAMYDHIKIEVKKNELYVDTIEEAIQLGFRRAKH